MDEENINNLIDTEDFEDFEDDFDGEKFEGFDDEEFDDTEFADTEFDNVDEDDYLDEEEYSNEEDYTDKEDYYNEEGNLSKENSDTIQSAIDNDEDIEDGLHSLFNEVMSIQKEPIESTEEPSKNSEEPLTEITGDSSLSEVDIQDNSFTDEFGNIVVQDKDGENFKLEYIPIQNIVVPNKRARKDAGVDELVTSIKNTGLLCPIVVAPLATEGTYVLIKGKRRLLALAKTGRKEIPCIVNTKIRTTEIPIIEVLYNHYRSYNIKEIIDYIEYLEKEKGINCGDTIEYLLQLNSGDYAKLKDVLTDNDPDIVNPLLQGQSTIDKAFKALEKRRKNETKEQQQQDKAEKVFGEPTESGLSGVKDSGEDAGECNLTDEEIKDLNVSLNNLDEEDKSLDEMVEDGKQMEGFEAHQQDTKHREHMDPAIRKAILARDNNTCRCCELGGESYLYQLDTHHVVPVFLGGKDEVDNGVTLCVLCHSLVHSWSTGDLQIPKSKSEEELKKLSTEEKVLYDFEQRRFKRVIKLGNYIREGMKVKGIKRDQLKKATYEANPGRNKPGQGQKADL